MQVHSDLLATLEHQVPLDSPEDPEVRVNQVSPALKEPLASLEALVAQEYKASQDHLDPKALLEHLASLVDRACQAHLGSLDLKEQPAHLAHPEDLASVEDPDREEALDLLDHLVHLDSEEDLEVLASQDKEVNLCGEAGFIVVFFFLK